MKRPSHRSYSSSSRSRPPTGVDAELTFARWLQRERRGRPSSDPVRLVAEVARRWRPKLDEGLLQFIRSRWAETFDDSPETGRQMAYAAWCEFTGGQRHPAREGQR